MQAKISTPAQRRKLPVSKQPVWESYGGARSGEKLGYRKGARGGVWIAKVVACGLRLETVLGPADDDGAPSGALNHAAAIAAAHAWAVSARARRAEVAAPLTVARVVQDYVDDRMKRNPTTGRDAKSRLGLHVLKDKTLADMPLADLSNKDLGAWRKRLPGTLSPATVNRLMNDFRAALRGALKTHWRDLPLTLPKEIETGLQATAGATTARLALLSDVDTRAVVAAAYEVDTDLGALCLMLASTGARFSQVAQISVADVQVKEQRIMVPASAKGKSSKARTSIPVRVGADVIQRIKPLLAGRNGNEILLMRWTHRQITPTQWERVERGPWSSAAHMQRGWKKALIATGLPYVEPYALRHSSIVRALRAGVPIRIVAGAHDTSTAMIEKHYSAYILDMADELMRQALVPLTTERPATFAIAG